MRTNRDELGTLASARGNAAVLTGLDASLADAILGIDTLWGGDVMNPSGIGRFIGDCWFSDASLPEAYTHPAAGALRSNGGVGARTPDVASVDAYLAVVDMRGAIARVLETSHGMGGPRGAYLEGIALCCEVMWDLAMEILGRGPAVPYERCVRTLTSREPEPSQPQEKRRRVAALLANAGYPSTDAASLLVAVDNWRAERRVQSGSIAELGDRFVATYDELSARNLLPYLPPEFARVPRANVRFLPIENAWFSGSMNYLGHARRADGSPEYEATYELNASLQISVPEFQHLVSHEVVPGHVTTFAYLQDLYVRGRVGFEASVLTMNTPSSALFEGIANNAVLIAHGVTEISDLPDPDLQLGVLLTLLQDDAKNQSSWLTWHEGRTQAEVAAELRRDYLVSEERADKLSGAWGRHPLLGRMYLPAYRAGTELVAELRRRHPPEVILPVLYGVNGIVDALNVRQLLES